MGTALNNFAFRLRSTSLSSLSCFGAFFMLHKVNGYAKDDKAVYANA